MSETPKVRFALSPWTMVVLLVGMAIVLIRQYGRLGDDASANAGRLAGAALALVLFPGIFALIAFYVSRRSRVVGNIVFALVLGLMVLGQVMSPGVRGNRRALDEAIEANRALTEEHQREFEQKGYVDDQGRIINAAARTLDEASAKMTGTEAAIAKAGAEFTRKLGAYATPHNDSIKRLSEVGGLNYEGLRSAGDVDARLAALAQLRRTNEAFASFMTAAPAEIDALMKAAGVPDAERARAVSQFLSGMQHGSQLRLREQDRIICDAGDRYFGILKRHAGRWMIKPDGLIFDASVPDADVDAMNAAADQINAAAAKQDALLAQIREAQRSRQPPGK